MQPVPCVLRLSMRGEARRCTGPGPVTSRSATSSPGRCPPLSSTAGAPMASRSRAAASSSCAASIGRLSNSAASSRLGVTTMASGNSSSTSTCTVVGVMSASPLVATITGSSTTRCTL
ncbi:hypothetical protein FQZ97_1033210 [compost metagenome]